MTGGVEAGMMDPMDINPVDGTTVTLLMVAGAVFAAAGLWLLLRPKPSGTAARIELFGMKFESSSAGVLVFLIGAVFRAIPIVVPRERVDAPTDTPAGGEAPETWAGETDGVSGPAVTTLADPGPGERAVVLPVAGAEEDEPNNTVHEANQLAFGATARGVGEDASDLDWYVVPVSGADPVITVGLRLISGFDVEADVFDQHERQVGTVESRAGVAYLEVEPVDTDRLYVRVDAHSGGSATYEVFTRAGDAPGGG